MRLIGSTSIADNSFSKVSIPAFLIWANPIRLISHILGSYFMRLHLQFVKLWIPIILRIFSILPIFFLLFAIFFIRKRILLNILIRSRINNPIFLGIMNICIRFILGSGPILHTSTSSWNRKLIKIMIMMVMLRREGVLINILMHSRRRLSIKSRSISRSRSKSNISTLTTLSILSYISSIPRIPSMFMIKWHSYFIRMIDSCLSFKNRTRSRSRSKMGLLWVQRMQRILRIVMRMVRMLRLICILIVRNISFRSIRSSSRSWSRSGSSSW